MAAELLLPVAVVHFWLLVELHNCSRHRSMEKTLASLRRPYAEPREEEEGS
jgi:hypothetical protein